MKQKFYFVTALAFVLLVSTSCIFIGPSVKGNGNVAEENRKVGPFEKISVSRGMNVYISQGEKPAILVKADENLLDVIETKLEDNTLKITTSENIRSATSKKVFVTVTKISGIKSTAGSNVFSETLLEQENLEVTSAAGSNIKLEVKADDLTVSASSGANIMLEGVAGTFSGKATSGANIKAEGLKTNKCFVRAGSGANVWVSVNDTFEGSAGSGGNVFYYGNPKSVDTQSSSGGNVIRK